MVCSQVTPSVFVAVLMYAYLGALGCMTVGALGIDNVALRKLRAIGLLIVMILIFVLFWAIVGNNWCYMFFFSQFFSIKLDTDQQ